MVELDELFRTNPEWGGANATLFIDSNVEHEFANRVDLDREYELFRHAPPEARLSAANRYEAKRRQVRGTYWLAMVLDDEDRTTLTLGPESLPWMLTNAPPGTHGGAWASLIVHYIRDIVPGWRGTTLRERRGGRDANDSQIVEVCAKLGIPLISRDIATTLPKAKRLGVEFLSPEEYAARSTLSFDAARERFFERYDRVCLDWPARFGPGWQVDKAEMLVDQIREMIAAIWEDDLTFSPHDVPAPGQLDLEA